MGVASAYGVGGLQSAMPLGSWESCAFELYVCRGWVLVEETLHQPVN